MFAIGVDLDELSLREGMRQAPAPRVMARAEQLPVRPGSVKTLVFRESAHHFDLRPVLADARRLGVERLVFFEPNDGALLRLAHRIIGHHDQRLSVEYLCKILQEAGWVIIRKSFRDLLALPISGGFIAPWHLPRCGPLGLLLIRVEDVAVALLPEIIRRNFCFRYFVVAERNQ